jgi:hypothetical protein
VAKCIGEDAVEPNCSPPEELWSLVALLLDMLHCNQSALVKTTFPRSRMGGPPLGSVHFGLGGGEAAVGVPLGLVEGVVSYVVGPLCLVQLVLDLVPVVLNGALGLLHLGLGIIDGAGYLR